MIKRDQALVLLRKYIKTENTVKHLLATEAVMRTLARRLEPDKEEEWALAGLLHDIDYEQDLGKDYGKHGIMSVEILKKEKTDLPESVYQTILAHCYNLNPDLVPKNLMDWSLFICDSLTGLIVATALVRPDKKLSSVKVSSILKKFKDPSFARGTRREDIKLCEEKLAIPLNEFMEIGLVAMQGISETLGL
ncbi:MAG TPA: HD domain-containing protein [Candidatus Bathyarchaeia archaeon]|nr:HD domain-containing protein [Candidatus Bathyarchaeia archaeon]